MRTSLNRRETFLVVGIVGATVEVAITWTAYLAIRRKYGIGEVRFKAGLHAGPVVVGELGKYKRRKIVFAGDTMNVTTRLEEMSKQEGCRLVVTADYLRLVRNAGKDTTYKYLGKTALRGKQEKIELYCFRWVAG